MLAWAARSSRDAAKTLACVAPTRALSASATAASTRDESEVSKFSKIAGQWWDEDSAAFGALHRMNTVRVPIVVEAAAAARGSGGSRDAQHSRRSLDGAHILDAGCGGGILSEALGRLGGRVLGIDASDENVAAARAHVSLDPELAERVQYGSILVEDLVAEMEAQRQSDASRENGVPSPAASLLESAEVPGVGFDVVVSSEVVEHVLDPRLFVDALARCLRPGGSLVMTTITRTPLSYAGAIVAAERIAGLVPPGTHDYEKFLSPRELSELMKSAGLQPDAPEGIAYNPLTGQWSRGGRMVAIQYALTARKPHGV